MMIRSYVHDSYYAVLVHNAHFRLDTVQSSFVYGYIVVGVSDGIVGHACDDERERMQYFRYCHRIGIDGLLSLFQLFSE